MANKFRKKPVVIEAERVSVLLTLADQNWKGLPSWFTEAYEKGDLVLQANPPAIHVKTLEGTMGASWNDWLLRGVKNELYPCRDDIFRETYELVE